jgi:hypothetical protein
MRSVRHWRHSFEARPNLRPDSGFAPFRISHLPRFPGRFPGTRNPLPSLGAAKRRARTPPTMDCAGDRRAAVTQSAHASKRFGVTGGDALCAIRDVELPTAEVAALT